MGGGTLVDSLEALPFVLEGFGETGADCLRVVGSQGVEALEAAGPLGGFFVDPGFEEFTLAKEASQEAMSGGDLPLEVVGAGALAGGVVG